MALSDRIVADNDVLAGKPVIRGTRLSVGLILELLAAGQTEDQIQANYPGLTQDDILASRLYPSYLVTEYAANPNTGSDETFG